MWRLLLFAIILTLPLNQAVADSLVTPPASITAHEFEQRWSGFHFGFVGSVDWSGGDGSSLDFSGDEALFGAGLGYNWTSNNTVIGFEADFAFGDLGSDDAECAPTCSLREQWLATTRGRVGFNLNRLSPFLTAGIAIADFETNDGDDREQDALIGYVAGAGVDFAISGRWTARAEYLHVGFGDVNCGSSCGDNGDDVEVTSDRFRLGLSYKIGVGEHKPPRPSPGAESGEYATRPWPQRPYPDKPHPKPQQQGSGTLEYVDSSHLKPIERN